METKQMVSYATSPGRGGESTRLGQVSVAGLAEAARVFESTADEAVLVATPAKSSRAGLFLLLAAGQLLAACWLCFPPAWVTATLGALICRLAVGVLLAGALLAGHRALVRHIPGGMRGLIGRLGRHDRRSRSGYLVLAPWQEISHLVSERPTAFRHSVDQCDTSDHTPVRLDLITVFHIHDALSFVQSLSVRRFDDLLTARIEAGARRLVAEIDAARAHHLRGKSDGELVAGLNAEFNRHGVTFTSASILNVVLPRELASALANEALFAAKRCEHETQHEFYVKTLEDREALALRELALQRERSAAVAQAEREQAARQAEIAAMQRLERKRLAEIEAEERVALQIIEARGEARAARFKAQGLRLHARAQGEASGSLAALRAYHTDLARFKMLATLARAGNLTIHGGEAMLLGQAEESAPALQQAANLAFMRQRASEAKERKARVS